MNKKKILSYLSIAQKAGKLVSGEFMVENAIKDNSAKLVIIAEDASDNTTKKFMDMCNFRTVDIIKCSNKDELGHAIGKEFRVSAAVIDDGFAKAIKSCADDGGNLYSEKESN